jgi:transcriptional regulator with XRE-family HTH domain
MLAMSQEKLGAGLGLTFQQVQKYERGANRIWGQTIAANLRILQVPVEFFFEGAPNASVAHDSMEARYRWPRSMTSSPIFLVAVVTGDFLHEHHDPAPHGGIINSHFLTMNYFSVDGLVSGIKSHMIEAPSKATAAILRNVVVRPKLAAIRPKTAVLRAAPIPDAVPMMP